MINTRPDPPIQALINAPTGTRMLDAALFYAKRRGWAVFPVHVPLHNAAGKCVGCTCEHYKRSEKYRLLLVERGKGHTFDPNYKCSQPGKCPAVRWSEKSTTDEVQIRKCWARPWRAGEVQFIPNIGIDCGKSGLLTLDADAYKEHYAGSDLLSWEDRQTVTALTGGGGEHLLYDRGGADYGNTVGELPPGIDIRGVGGYIVAAPSLHKSGRRYAFESNYGPHEIALKPIPETLRTILEQAHQQKQARETAAIAITFGAIGVDAPDLSQWELSETILDMIHNPAGRGQRSEHDYAVVCALCEAGGDDDTILSVFAHYPVGTAGKYAESGADYLARTLTNARASLAKRAEERRRNLATIDAAHLWGRTNSFAGLIPEELRTQYYMTDASDTKVYDAILAEYRRVGQMRIEIGKKRLAKLAGVSPNTVVKVLPRLGNIFSITTAAYGMVIALHEDFRRAHFAPFRNSPNVDRGQSARDEHNEYTPRKATDPFLTGTSRTVKERAREASIVAGGTLKEWLATIPKGLGEGCLRALDALGRCGEMTKVELQEETGKTAGAIGRACVRLEREGLLESKRETSRAPKVYSLVPDVWRKVDELAPSLRTHQLSDSREATRLKEAQRWTVKEQAAAVEAGNEEAYKRLDKRLARLGNQRIKVLGHIYPQMAPSDLANLAFDVQMPQAPHPALLAKMQRLHENARMDAAEERRSEGWQLTAEVQRLRQEGAEPQEAARQLQIAGYAPSETWQAIHRVWPRSQPLPAQPMD